MNNEALVDVDDGTIGDFKKIFDGMAKAQVTA